MIWHIHWIEMRGGLFWALGFSLFAAVLNLPSAAGLSTEALAEFVATRGIFAAFFVGLMAGGDGLDGPWHLRGHPCHLYKLSLPVARRTLVGSRITAAALAAMMICTAVTASALAWAADRGAAIDAPVLTTAHGLSLLSALAVAAAVAGFWAWLNRFVHVLAALVLVALAVGNASWASEVIVDGRVPWISIVAAAAVAAAGIVSALVNAPRKELP